MSPQEAAPGEELQAETRRLRTRLDGALGAMAGFDTPGDAGFPGADPVVGAIVEACIPSLRRVQDLRALIDRLAEGAAPESVSAALRELAARRPGNGPR